jgi:6-phosphogluconolactonase (cycloisomerase 2 family)
MKKILCICGLLGVIVAGCLYLITQGTQDKEDDTLSLYLVEGSYASASQEGVRLYRFDELTGDLKFVNGLRGIANPSFLVPSVEGSRIYAVEESAGDSATVKTLFFDKSSERLSVLSSQPTLGNDPCYVALNPSCHFVVTANYSGGNISIFAMDIDGKLKPDPLVVSFKGHGPVADRQQTSHPHCITFTPDHRYMLVSDLGVDCIHMLPVSVDVANGVAHSLIDEDEIQDIPLEPGSGPRHIAFHPNGRYAYLINELSGMVTLFEYKEDTLTERQSVAADESGAQGAADIHVSRDGRFVYASVRLKNDGITIYSVDSETGFLTKVGYQPTGLRPRTFVLSPNGDYLLVACRDSNYIQIFKVDKETGMLTDTGKKAHAPNVSCLQFVR